MNATTEDEAMLRAVVAAPADDVQQLIYADWLDERGDPRGAYLRAQVEYRRVRGDEQRRALVQLYPHEHLAWASTLEQAGAADANLTRHDLAWWGMGFAPDRVADGTYERFRYHDQPPLPTQEFDGTFAWLLGTPPEGSFPHGEAWKSFCAQTRSQGYFIPAEFERFMGSTDLLNRIPACTDSYFQAPPDPSSEVPTPAVEREDGFLVSFYADSQYCVLWAILLPREPGRYAPVLAGPPEALFPGCMDAEDGGDDSEADDGERDDPGEPVLVAPQFESFVYRWWIENEIWYATQWPDTRRPLTPAEQAYLDHFRRGPAEHG